MATRRRSRKVRGMTPNPILVLLSSLLGLTGRQSMVDRLRHPSRDERGLSQSTENAILLAGAAALAGTIIAVITVFVKSRLPH